MKQITGNKPENGNRELIRQLDIGVVIDYFGCTELLDNIGFAAIADYLKGCEKDRLYEGADGSTAP
ncbi:hypothetical protein SAMN05660226_03024 [Parapedobacter luteus]|uniref:Uncharacterized protein n=1 Tax=Parapedobacter luteus TaxID=623280 RepID=A0A1T5DVW0_9SPHI|nr:hypothetical protein [Parapedobacter luteus]SKB75700.1 hypothetical protein SAMN05660226_03024 [Parapedobacter luteus]